MGLGVLELIVIVGVLVIVVGSIVAFGIGAQSRNRDNGSD